MFSIHNLHIQTSASPEKRKKGRNVIMSVETILDSQA